MTLFHGGDDDDQAKSPDEPVIQESGNLGDEIGKHIGEQNASIEDQVV